MIEYAMLKTPAGVPVVRSAALESFEKFQAAIERAGGRAPRGADGERMLWNEQRGWFPRTEIETRAMSGGSFGETSGDGWRLAVTRDDRALEAVAREMWHIGLRLPWPSGWQVRFADLWGRHDGYAAVTLYAPHRLILIDRENYLERGDSDLERSLHEELAHLAVGWAVDHGPLFHTTLHEIRTRCPKLIPAWR